MSDRLEHRGPDDAGAYIDAGVGFAMRRLSIIDIEGGHQPLSNEDGTVVAVCNGEIYNYRELREELQRAGHKFRTQSDTEVIVHLFEELGPRFPARLRGMFAIALWDTKTRTAIFARDRFGIKPLVYSLAGDQFAFSSELKSLVEAPGFDRSVSASALASYLTFNWITAPATIYTSASKLPPGCVLVLRDGVPAIDAFAKPYDGETSLGDITDSEAEEQLISRLADAVAAHMVADVPVGVLLSGGVDSSLITALASRHSHGSLKTFSIGFDDPEYNELAKARRVAAQFGTEHHEIVVRPDIADVTQSVARTLDEPLGDSSAVPTYLVSALAAADVKVALSGDGGDELFGGYNTYVADWLGRWLWPATVLARPAIRRTPDTASRISDRVKRFVEGARLPPLERHCAWLEVFSAEQRSRLVTAEWQDGSFDTLAEHRRQYNAADDLDPAMRLQHLDVTTYLADDLLRKVDMASMAHSLEVRVPLLDFAVSDFAYHLPAHLKVQRFAKKRVLRRVARTLLPADILDSRKQGFSIPASSWLRNDLRPLLDEVLSPAHLTEQGFFDARVVRRLVDEHTLRRADHSRRIWSVMMFTLWADHHGLTT